MENPQAYARMEELESKVRNLTAEAAVTREEIKERQAVKTEEIKEIEERQAVRTEEIKEIQERHAVMTEKIDSARGALEALEKRIAILEDYWKADKDS